MIIKLFRVTEYNSNGESHTPKNGGAGLNRVHPGLYIEVRQMK